MSRSPFSSRRRSFSATSLPAISEDSTVVGSPHPPPYSFENHKDWPGKLHLPLKHEPDRSPGEERRFKPRGWLGRQVERRGGWIRLLIGFVVLLALIALGIGLGVGLSHKNSNSTSSEAESKIASGEGEAEKPFPESIWRFETVLSSVHTDCTSDNSTYRCYPYTTFSQSPESANTVFDWVIEAVDRERNSYQISSTANPFSIVFTNATLTLLDGGTQEERFEFSIPLNVAIIPSKSLDARNTNRASICNYSDVVFSGSIFAKKEKTWPMGSSAEGDEGRNPKRWPYAAEMRQSVSSAPTCRDAVGNSMGNFGREGTAGGECACTWTNFGI